jgi:hypothetical protein
MTDPHWTTYLAALLTPTIAVFGATIAYRQWRIAQNKLKLDLFERRLVIYEAARGYISSVMTSGKTSQIKEMEFLSGTRGAKWLFDDEIVNYLNKVLWHKICALGCVQSELEGMPAGEEHTKKIHAQAELKKWLMAQEEVIDNKFSPFLSLRH